MKNLFLLTLFIMLSACGSTDISRFIYIVDGSHAQAIRENPLPQRCLVNNFRVSSWLRKRDIPVRPTPNRIDYYDQYSWVTVPAVLFAEYTYEAFRRSNLFSLVVRSTEESGLNLTIDGYLDHLELVQKDDSVFAWIEGELSCNDIQQHTLVARQRFSGFKAIEEDATAEKFVQTSKEIFQINLYQFMKKCEKKLESGD